MLGLSPKGVAWSEPSGPQDASSYATEFISEEMKSRASIARLADFLEMQFEQPRRGCDVPRELC